MSDEMNIGDQTEHQPKLRLASQSARPARTQPPAATFTIDDGVAGDGVHLLDYVKVAYKRRWSAATAFLLVFVSATVYTFTATPIYEAKTRLLIEAENPNVVSFKQVIDEDQTKIDYYQTQYNILQSRALARRTIDSMKLWDSPQFGGGPAGQNPSFSLRGAIGGGIATVTGLFKSEETKRRQEAAAASETAAQSRAIDAFLANLSIAPIRNSRLVDVRYRLSDPELATGIVNALARNYIEQTLEYKFMASKEASDWLGDRLSEQRRSVEQAEAKLQQYREQNDAISLQDRENIVVQKLGDLNAAVTRAKTERIQKEAMYNQLRSIERDNAALDSFPAILGNTFIQQQKAELADLQRQHAQLSEKFGEKHPEIIRVRTAIQSSQNKLQAEITKVVLSVKNEYQAALTQEQSLSAALGQQKGEALAMNRKAIDYGVLERDVQSSKQMYESLLQRAKETTVSGELKTSNIRIVDVAEQPRGPVSPRKALNLLLAVVGGTFVAFGLAFFFEYIDSRIKSPDELKAHLGLPALGIVPALGEKSSIGKDPLISSGVPPNFAEAFRTLRTNVLFSSAEEGARVLVVTSTGPGEGKTMVASNMAIAFAQAGQRVLLIDADMRRPRLHDVFRRLPEPGLSNLLVGTAKASEALQKSDTPGLWVMTSGRIPPNPAELLGSQRFKDFLKSLKDHFDCVIVDSPPVMAVSDATIAAHIATGVVFVVGADMTSRHSAKAAIEQLSNAHVHFVGAVLNRVELDRNPYYYAKYYRREYSSYYTNASAAR
jgi:capsular exopolysaccharide synthesis family protein